MFNPENLCAMLGRIIVKAVIDGVLKNVEVIKYSNGKEVKRVLDKNGVPERIIK